MGTSNNLSFVSNTRHEKKMAYVLKVIPFSKNAVFVQKKSY